MCGRYATSRRPEELVEEFEVEETAGGPGQDVTGATPNYNVAPTAQVPVVLERADTRWLRALTWGLVPSWAKDRAVGQKMINARAETLTERPAYRRAARARRCLVPADGWYEWQTSPVERDGRGRPRKQPFWIHPRDAGPIALAGLYDLWRPADVDPADLAAWLCTFTVVTTAAEPGLTAVHDRMPMVLPRDRWDAWLDPELAEDDGVRGLLEPPAPGRFAAVPVSTRVNAVAHNSPDLLDPVPVTQLRGVVDPVTGELYPSVGDQQEPHQQEPDQLF